MCSIASSSPADDAHREDGREVFGVPVFLGRRLHVGHDCARFVVAAQLDALLSVDFRERRQHFARDAARDEQRFHRVACAEALRFRVVRDAHGLVEVRLVVDVDVAHAVQVLDHRDARLALQALDQAFAAARHDHVDVILHGDQLADGGAVGGLDHLHRGFGQARRLEAFVHARGDRLVGVDRFGAAAQDRGVARLQAQPRGVGGDVRARFVNDADHAERHAHLAHLDARRPVAQFDDLADRIGKLRDLPQAVGHGRDALVREREAIDRSFVEPGSARGFEVARVGREQRLRVALERLRRCSQRLVLGVRVGFRDEGAKRPAPRARHRACRSGRP